MVVAVAGAPSKMGRFDRLKLGDWVLVVAMAGAPSETGRFTV